MKKFLVLLLAIVMCLPTFSAFGCANVERDSRVLRVCNCEDYIEEDLLAEFTEETGIEVVYSTYGTNENLYNELVINPNSYDVVVPSEYMIEKLAEEGRIQKLDFSQLSGYNQNVSAYIDQRLEGLTFTIKDGKYKGEKASLSEFMVGYMWGTMGWVYNADNVSQDEVKSWTGVFDNPVLNKRITIKDAVRDSYLVGLAMVYGDELRSSTTNEQITEILNRVDKQSIDKVGAKLSSLKSMLYGFEVDSGKNDIVLGNIDAYVAWSGDAAYAIDVATGVVKDDDGNFVDNTRNLSYYIPDEGSNIWFDGLVVPTGSTNVDLAYKFMEFISRPENVYRNMNYIGYTSMVAGDGSEEIEVENKDGGIDKMTLFEAVVLDWFDESGDLEDGEGLSIDLSYFFGNDGDYRVTVSEEGYGRLIAQYPTAEIVERCAIMSNFSSETLLTINDMWEGVKGETFPIWLILLIVVLVVLLAVLVVIYRNKEKIKWIKLPHKKMTLMEKKGYKIVKVQSIDG